MPYIEEKPIMPLEEQKIWGKKQQRGGFAFLKRLKEMAVGTGDTLFKASKEGVWLGRGDYTNAPLRFNFQGEIFAKRLTLENFVKYDDSSISYTGTWTAYTQAFCYGRGEKVSTTVDDYFEISFFGKSIGLLMTKSVNKGKLKIYIDNVFLETIDLYNSVILTRMLVWQKIDLAHTVHTLKGVVETKNPSSSGNGVGLQGYTLFPHSGIKVEQLSADLYIYAVNKTTDANGYAGGTVSAPAGYVAIAAVGITLQPGTMSDADQTDPKLCWRGDPLYYLYNGKADTTYTVEIGVLISKL